MTTRAALIAAALAALVGVPAALAQSEAELKRLDELDRKCEAARLAKLVPIRAELIDRCVRIDKRPREVCESEFAHYGDTKATAHGKAIAGLFYDLPECVAAFEARQKYRR
ncbi:MAG: hypothetical protein N3D71_02920 [Burkholderiaceae bacterium]|nr:hypothetical protein [Burkholderiaceae bacterium]